MANDDVFVHEHGLCESDEVAGGTRVWAFAHVMAGARVGRDCNICGHSFVEDGAVLGNGVVIKNGVQVWRGVTLEDHVFVGPNATFTNDLRPRAARPRAEVTVSETLVKRGASLGANCTVVCGHVVGQEAFVAAGAVVASDVPPNAMMVGNPARRVGWVCGCGEGLPDHLACSCGRRYRLADDDDEALGLEPAD